MGFFEGFALDFVDAGEATLRVRHGGDGPPVVLVHGHPRTHATWHMVADRLAERFTVVCPDLRGYGRSSKVEPYSKRAMAADVAGLMRKLGHERFHAVGHDRGALVAMRLGLDHRDVLDRLVILEGLPVVEHLERGGWRFAEAWWHWWFFAQLEKPAERVINADPDAWYRATPEHMGDEAFADLRAALHDPDVVHGMLEDYRAGLRADREHEEADRAAGRKIECPLLVGWALRDNTLELHPDALEIWRRWATDVREFTVDCGHHMAEECPAELAAVLAGFLAGDEPEHGSEDRVA
jgi:haloacetate dehalogenase